MHVLRTLTDLPKSEATLQFYINKKLKIFQKKNGEILKIKLLQKLTC